MSTSRQIYAERLSAVNTDTTLPLVRNLFRCRPSSPTSEKNCLFPVPCQQAKVAHYAPLLTLLSPEQADEEDARAVHGKQGTDGIELSREDAQHDEGEGELADGGADVGAFKRPLRCPDLHELCTRQDNGARAVSTQPVRVYCVTALEFGECERECKW